VITAAAGRLPKQASSMLSAARFLERGKYGHDVRLYLTQAIATLTDPHEAVERAEHACQAARAAETPQAEP
jgi:hypothetical protein